MDRKEQQADFLVQVGFLLKPVLDVIDHPEQYDATERARIRARFHVDFEKFRSAVKGFCNSEPGAAYLQEWHDINHPLSNLGGLVQDKLVGNPAGIAEQLRKLRADLSKAILAIPVAVDSVIYEARTPFTAYCRIRELCVTTRQALLYCDRYVSHTLFHRLLEDVSPDVQITLVTWPRAKHNNPRAFDSFVDVSRLFAKERPTTYRLLVKPDFHDRWLQTDGQLFHPGGSIKDAADSTVFTLSRVDPTPANLQKVADLVNTAAELFGPSTPNHP